MDQFKRYAIRVQWDGRTIWYDGYSISGSDDVTEAHMFTSLDNAKSLGKALLKSRELKLIEVVEFTVHTQGNVVFSKERN